MTDDYKSSERRKYRRVVFSAGDGVFGEIELPGFPDNLISAKISDISAGGMQFIVPRNNCRDIDGGSIIFLRNIKGMAQFGFVSQIELEVKWILDSQEFENIMIGCEFLKISKTVQKRIDQLIEADLEQKRRIVSN